MGRNWSGQEAGAFDAPTLTTPLYIYINDDMDLLTAFRDQLVRKKSAESTIQKAINRYTTHIAFHLYQMYQKQKQLTAVGAADAAPTDEQMHDEIQRVAHTMIKLMEVNG